MLKSIILAAAIVAMTTASFAANVNTDTAEVIANDLYRVGKIKSEAIVAYRDANGPFKSAEDLVKVKGIGKKTIENNAAKIEYDMPAK
jgi:competence protein ComEA